MGGGAGRAGARFRGRKAAKVVLVAAAILAADLALSLHAPELPAGEEGHDHTGLTLAGAGVGADPPAVPRSKTFPRLGSIALNLTPCLHHSSEELARGFTCEPDVFSAFLDGHTNGDHFRHAVSDAYDAWFVDRFDALPPALQTQLGSWQALKEDMLLARGVTPQLVASACEGRPAKPLANLTEVPDLGEEATLIERVVASSLCRFVPFFPDAGLLPASLVAWGQMDGPVGAAAGGELPVGGPGGHGHEGPHGLAVNAQTNWLYAAMSHQGKLAVVNLNVVDWGKVAAYEETTGYRVLLFEDESVFEPRAVLYYASALLKEARGNEAGWAKTLDAAHRACFEKNRVALGGYAKRWEDGLQAPNPTFADALEYVRTQVAPPTAEPPIPASATGFACFLAFAGIEAARWDDPRFSNPYCTYDTRHLAIHDARHSPGVFSRANAASVGEGDAWRCGWFTRYVPLTKDFTLKVRRLVPVDAGHDFGGLFPEGVGLPLKAGSEDAELPYLAPPTGGEWVETELTIKIGPHDIAYNPVNGNLYVTHYWTMDDPDIRALPDWTLHLLVGDPLHPQFHNPYAPGPDAGPFTIDVGGPLDGLHPVTVDVDTGTGDVYVANRESNTISQLIPRRGHLYSADAASTTLAGDLQHAVARVDSTVTPRAFEALASADPTEPGAFAQLQGEHHLGPLPLGSCDAFASGLEASLHLKAAALCADGILVSTGAVANASLPEVARRELGERLRGAIGERTRWPGLVADLRETLPAVTGEGDADLAAFRARWYPHLVSSADVLFLEDGIRSVVRAPANERDEVAATFFAHAAARLVGATGPLLDALVSIWSEPEPIRRDERLRGAAATWAEAARSGALLGFHDAPIPPTDLLYLGFSQGAAPEVLKKAIWLEYCVGYSVLDAVQHLAGADTGTEDTGLDPLHCDDVAPPHVPGPTPLQRDQVGESNGHLVIVVREPLGATLDLWHEARPRFLQPFDVWFNAGDRNVYVSNLGNHDNDPILKGWVTQLSDGLVLPCWPHEAVGVGQEALPKLPLPAPVSPGVPCPVIQPPADGIVTAEPLLPMGHLPHHLNVNPYTDEVYAGHLASEQVIVAQVDEKRATWSIEKQRIFSGPDTRLGSPTGMAVNPSTQRLFFTRFAAAHHGGGEDLSRLVGVVDLRTGTATAEALYGGDHHAVADATAPPMGTTADPFYNRTRELAIGNRSVLGSLVATGDTSGTISFPWRCTYYGLHLDLAAVALPPSLPGLADARGPLPVRVDRIEGEPFRFDAGRCFNLFDLSTVQANGINLVGAGGAPPDARPDVVANARAGLDAWRGRTVVTLNATAQVWYETGLERLTFGMLHLYLDPDNVPPGLRVTGGGDESRRVRAGFQATEELAGAYLETDVPTPVVVPRGDAVLAPEWPTVGPGRWSLAFETSHVVEAAPPSRRAWLAVAPGAAAGGAAPPPLVVWDADAFSGAGWREARVPLADAVGPGGVLLRFEHDAGDAAPVEGTAWEIAGFWIESRSGRVRLEEPSVSIAGEGAFERTLFEDPLDAAGTVPGVGFRDAGLPASGAFTLSIPAPVDPEANLVVLQRSDLVLPPAEIRQPYDVMRVDVSLDGGLSWRLAWRNDSRDASQPDLTTARVDLTPLLFAGNASPLFRLRFDAVDPAHNDYPGWRVVAPRLERPDGNVTALVGRAGALASAPSTIPAWVDRAPPGAPLDLAFVGADGTYQTSGRGVVCRLGNGGHGGWGGAGSGLPGSGRTTLCARDLAGNEVRALASDGLGLALVSDSFADDGFTERYWRREESDPWGIGHAAYVFDPRPGGLGEIMPRDTPAELADLGVLAPASPGPGENLLLPRGILRERNPSRSNVQWAEDSEVMEASVRVDAPTFRRAFVLTPGEADRERVSAGLRAVLDQEDGFLNASHLRLMRPTDPIAAGMSFLEKNGLFASDPMRDESTMGGDAFLWGAVPAPSHVEYAALSDAARATAAAAVMGAPRGVRTHLDVEPYVLGAVPTLRPQASERLSHAFPFDPTTAQPTAIELSFDVVVRHRFEDYLTSATPSRPLPELTSLAVLLHNVTLDRIEITRDQFDALVGPNDVVDEAFASEEWRKVRTLADVGATGERLRSLLAAEIDGVAARLSFEVAASELLNDVGLADLNLPIHDAGYAVRVSLLAPDGTTHVLAERDGIDGRPLDVTPVEPGGDVRVTLAPSDAPGAFDVRVLDDFARVERLHARFEGAAAAAILAVPGSYTLVVETRARAPLSPAPGTLQEVAYGPLALRVETGPPVANAPPDASFGWWGPVGVGQGVAFHPGRVLSALANAEDADGRIVRYEWTFEGADADRVALDGRRLVADADPDPLDDRATNAVATSNGQSARRLTLTQPAPGLVRLAYDANGCNVPIPTVRFPEGGAFAVTLRVRDDAGAWSESTQTVRVGLGNGTRPPELLVEPVESAPGEATVYWQQNRGSLLLRAEGRALNLTRFIENFTNETLDELDRANLTARIGFGNTSEVTRDEILAALDDPAAFERAVFDDGLNRTAWLLDWLLVRPGVVRVVSTEPQDAAGGARLALRLGELPSSGRDVGVDLAAGILRRTGGALPVDTSALAATRVPVPTIAVPDPRFEDLERLWREMMADAWVLRYALHPDVNGSADLNATVAQLVVVDAGLGPAYFALLDATDEVYRLARGAGDGLSTLSALDLDVLLPVDAYERLARALARATLDLSGSTPSLRALARAVDAPLSPVQGAPDPWALADSAAQDVGLSTARLEARRLALAEAYDEVELFRVDAHAGIAALQARFAAAYAEAEADLAPWGSSVTSRLVAERARERVEAMEVRSAADLAEAGRVVEATAAAARLAVEEIDAAYNATLLWAGNWTGALAAGDVGPLLRRTEAAVLGADAILAALLRDAEGFRRNLTDPLLALLAYSADDAVHVPTPSNQSVVLGFDADDGRAFVRVGNAVLRSGIVDGPKPGAVHASITFASLLPQTVEVQAMWGGRGATLYDGFNRNATLDARFEVDSLGHPTSSANASARILAPEESDGSWQLSWVSRSPEALPPREATSSLLFDEAVDPTLAQLGKVTRHVPASLPELLSGGSRAGRLDEHRSSQEPRASHPSSAAARQPDGATPTASARVLPADLPASVAARLEEPVAYSAKIGRLDGNVLQEVRVARAGGQRLSTSALHHASAAPLAPHVFDVQAFQAPGGAEKLRISFQPAGRALPAIERYEVYASLRPLNEAEATGRLHLGTVLVGSGADGAGEPGWTPGVDHETLVVDALPVALRGEWRHLSVKAVSAAGESPFSASVLLPPARIEQRFGTLREGPLVSEGARTHGDDGRIHVELGGLALTLEGDACLGDTVAITRASSHPHDDIAAPWARSLLVRERGLDALLSILRQLGEPLASLPLDLRALDLPIPEHVDFCPSLASLARDVHGIVGPDLLGELAQRDVTSILAAVGADPAAAVPPVDPATDPVLGPAFAGRHAEAWSNLTRRLLGNATLDLDLRELLHGAPAGATWRTEPIEGAWTARARFQVPSPLHTQPLSADRRLSEVLPAAQLNVLGALLPLPAFRVLEVGNLSAEGAFVPIAAVELGAALPTPLGDLRAVPRAALAVASVATPDLVAASVEGSDTRTSTHPLGHAYYDRWHTVEIFASDAGAGEYAVALDGEWIATLRTSSALAPNAIRVGGSPLPHEVLVDDVRLAPAIHPPAPLARIAPAHESHAFTAVSWFVPETGGAPLLDFNLLKRDLVAGGPAEIAATAAAGHLRTLVDPASFDPPAGARHAYAVQAVSALREGRNVGPASDARVARPPAHLRVSGDTSVSFAHHTDALDREVYDGLPGLIVGTEGPSIAWRSLLVLNASEVTDARGRHVAPRALADATLLVYAFDSDSPTEGLPLSPIHEDGEVPLLLPPDLRDPRILDRLGRSVSASESHGCSAIPFVVVRVGCHDAGPAVVDLCGDLAQNLEMQQLPFNCEEDAIGAHVAASSAFDVARASYATLPTGDLARELDAIGRQTTRNEAWRRYELLPAIRRDADGDVSVVLKRENERPDTTTASYASSEAATWLDERVGIHGRGPRARSPWSPESPPGGLPWSEERASSGRVSIRLGGHAGASAIEIVPPGVHTVPLDAPIRMDVFVPSGSAPRAIGLRAVADVYGRASVGGGFDCRKAFPGYPAEMTIVWGDETLGLGPRHFNEENRTVLASGAIPREGRTPIHEARDHDGELGPGDDLLSPLERPRGHHAGGVPPQRDRWVTLAFDPAQALAENANWTTYTALLEIPQLVGGGAPVDTKLPVPLPAFLANATVDERTLRWRERPLSWLGVVDGHGDGTDALNWYPTDALVVPWFFDTWNFDTYGLRWYCGMRVHSLEIFAVDGEVFVDRLGPDVGPRVRIGGGSS